jgi:methionine synthase / methylenetetrahydrofolate reductase(NADPH)
MSESEITPTNRFLSLLISKKYDLEKPILSDGAMGTVLHQRGVAFDECFDQLNLTNPAVVGEVHREYIEAGSQIIQTNTYGANRYKLDQHGLKDKVKEINVAGVELVRRVALASFKDVLIAGDVGPLGIRLVPFGRVQLSEAREAFSEQIKALIGAGIDLLIIETISDVFEMQEALFAALEINADIPIITSMTFTRDDRTMLGDSPEKVAKILHESGTDVIGVNCSGGPNQILRLLTKMHRVVPQGLFSVMPNAGWPDQVGNRIMYSATPDYFRSFTTAFWRSGANVIGGCCGTTPEHIKIMAETIQSSQVPITEDHHILGIVGGEDTHEPEPTEPTLLAKKLHTDHLVITVEMTPPRGLSAHKLTAGASLLAEAGADAINVSDSPMARMRMSPWAVCNLIQRKVGIETILHFPTRGRNLLRVQGDLLASHALDVRNIFVLMGDPTAIGDYPNATDNYDLVPSGLIKLIKQEFNTGVDHAGSDIGQPASFFVGCALNLSSDKVESEARTLCRKIRAGADFILTQPIYDPSLIELFLEYYEDAYQPLQIPIITGVLPLANARHAAFLQHEVPGIDIPSHIQNKMIQAGNAANDRASGEQAGIEIAIELIQQVKSYVSGIYLMPPFKRYDMAATIIEEIRSQTP